MYYIWITSTDSSEAEIARANDLAKKSNRIIAFTFSSSSLAEGQAKLINSLMLTGKPMVVVSLGLPYDIKDYPQIGAYIATYSIDRWGSMEPSSSNAAIDVIFGSSPGGKLPVNINGIYQFGDHLSY